MRTKTISEYEAFVKAWLKQHRMQDKPNDLYPVALSLLSPIKVFLDDQIKDVRRPSIVYPGEKDEDWVLVDNIQDATNLLLTEHVSIISLDNDLGEGKQEGYMLVNWMVHANVWPTSQVLVHSRNIVRAKMMREDIVRYFKPYVI